MIVRIRGGQGKEDREEEGEEEEGGIRSWREPERESVYLSSSSPDSDREQTTEDNEKQIFGREEGEEGETQEKEGQGEVG